MDEELASENVNGKNEKKIERKSEKDKKNKESIRQQEAPSSEKEEIAGRERDNEKRQDKKKNKRKKDAASDNDKGSGEGEITDVNGEDSSEPISDIVKRKRKKREKKKNKNEKFENTCTEEEVERNESKKLLEGESASWKESGKEANKERKKQKLKTSHEDNKNQMGEKVREVVGTHKVDVTEVVEKKKKKEKDKKKSTRDGAVGPEDTYSEAKNDEGDVQSTKDDMHATEEPGRKKKKSPKKKEGYKDDSSAAQQDSVGNVSHDLDNIKSSETENANKRKKRKTTIAEKGSDDRQDNEVEKANNGKRRKTVLVEDGVNDATPNKSNKKVRFSGEDEVFHLPDSSNTEEGNGEDNLVRGKRFTKAEDEIVKQAVLNYIEEHELGDEGLDMVMNCNKNGLRGCWKEIGSCIPYRPYVAVYCRARVLFMRSENRGWTQEEYDEILEYHSEHGSKWKALADKLGKHTWHVKDTYRRIKLPNLNKGNWTQVEYQKLFDLVNTDLQLKLSEVKKSKHGMLRDNISWSAISDELSTRTQATCCKKWYNQLTSPMVAEGVWADSDDFRLIGALYRLDATCMEDVDWDDLIENRSGDLCRKRWNQMVLHIGHYGRKSFAERVEILAQRYCPHLLEAREIWDSKPRVP